MKKFILNPFRLQGQGLGVIMGYLATAYSISKSLDRKPVLYLDALEDTLFSLQQTQEDYPGYSEQKQDLLDTFPNISKHFDIEKEIPSIANPNNPNMEKFFALCGAEEISQFFAKDIRGKNEILSIDAYPNRYFFEYDLDFFRDELFVFNDKILEKVKPYVEIGGTDNIAVSLRLEYHLVQKKNKSLPTELYHTALSPKYYSEAFNRFDCEKFPRGVMAFVFSDYPEEASNFVDQIHFANGKMVLLGNKCDLSNEREILHDTAQQFADTHNIPYLETSAKENIQVEDSFKLLSTLAIKNIINKDNERKYQTSKNNCVISALN